MKFIPKQLYHVYNRGNNKQPIFYSEENYFFFLKKMKNHITKHSEIIAYCLMPNHFHWLLVSSGEDSGNDRNHTLSQQIGTLLSSYTQAINKRYNRTGSLFQQRTKTILLDTQIQAQTCFHYIHQNPIKAGLVKKMGEWPYSSFRDFAGKRKGTLVKKDVAFNILDIQEDSFIEKSKQGLDPEKIQALH